MANNGNPTGREAAAERRIEALELRKLGASYRTIGERLGVSTAQAFEDVRRELAKLAKQASEIAGEVRAIELERLDDMLRAIAPQLRQGNLGAIDRALRIQERRSKLLGLDAPERQVLQVEEPIAIVLDR